MKRLAGRCSWKGRSRWLSSSHGFPGCRKIRKSSFTAPDPTTAPLSVRQQRMTAKSSARRRSWLAERMPGKKPDTKWPTVQGEKSAVWQGCGQAAASWRVFDRGAQGFLLELPGEARETLAVAQWAPGSWQRRWSFRARGMRGNGTLRCSRSGPSRSASWVGRFSPPSPAKLSVSLSSELNAQSVQVLRIAPAFESLPPRCPRASSSASPLDQDRPDGNVEGL